MNYIIRKASIEDAEGKGYVHYQSWIETYTGLFPKKVMEKLSLERSVTIAREHPEKTFVAIKQDQIVGFASYLESRDEDLQNSGEIMAIYVLKEFQGQGIGTALLEACYKELMMFSSISLWVLKSNNHAIDFYQSKGFQMDGKEKIIYEREIVRMIKYSAKVYL